MARIGMKKPVYAEIDTLPSGGFPTYKTGRVLSQMMAANVSINLNDAKLYGDGRVVDSDKSFSDGTLEISITDIPEDDAKTLLANEEITVEGETVILDAASQDSPEVGFGFYSIKRVDKVRTFVGYWYFRTKFGIPSDDFKQKEGKIEFSTPKITGDIMTIDDGKDSWRIRKTFATEGAVITWLESMANIGAPADKTTLNATIATIVGLDPEVYTSASWVDCANALATAQAVTAKTSPSQTEVDAANTALLAAQAVLVEV